MSSYVMWRGRYGAVWCDVVLVRYGVVGCVMSDLVM